MVFILEMDLFDDLCRRPGLDWRRIGVPAIRLERVPKAAIYVLISCQNLEDVYLAAIFKQEHPPCQVERPGVLENKTSG